ncbi:MAG: hypothetical protein E6Q90_05885 [Actinobacteria bacterium]|nr:MAG: hypothetical protein E6Q90_05885 [Actinomycetota bacterium]
MAESPKELLREAGCPRELDHRWLRQWLAGQADPSGTPYCGISRLEPGQALHFGSNGPRVVDVVGPECWPEPDLDGKRAEEAFLSAFDTALGELLGDENSVACEMSGGLDSTFMVASVLQRRDVSVRAFTHIPHPDASLRQGGMVPSDEAAAAAMIEHLGDRVQWERIWNRTGRGPLAMAREISMRAMWPAYGTGNLEWLDAIRRRARGLGFRAVWVGTHGNLAFSGDHGYARASRSTSVPRRVVRRLRSARARPSAVPGIRDLLRLPPQPRAPAGREAFLASLAGRRTVHAGLLNPDAFDLPSIDPYRHRLVVETAARIRPEAWLRDGIRRGFARTVSAGRLADQVRLRELRGVQGGDVWHWMYKDRGLYLDRLGELPATPAIADLVDGAVLRHVVESWPWGDPTRPPPQTQIAGVNRVLSLAQFIRDAEGWLSAF